MRRNPNYYEEAIAKERLQIERTRDNNVDRSKVFNKSKATLMKEEEKRLAEEAK